MNNSAKLPANWDQLLDAFEITLRAVAQITCEQYADKASLARLKHQLERQVEQSPRDRPTEFSVGGWAEVFGLYVNEAYIVKHGKPRAQA